MAKMAMEKEVEVGEWVTISPSDEPYSAVVVLYLGSTHFSTGRHTCQITVYPHDWASQVAQIIWSGREEWKVTGVDPSGTDLSISSWCCSQTYFAEGGSDF